MARRRSVRLGIIVPPSNTALEPIINAILVDLNNANQHVHFTARYSRFRVTTISADGSSNSQFEQPEMLGAASLLADANVDAIAWSGTSAGWLGIDRDRQLCAEIKRKFCTFASTSTLSLANIMHQSNSEVNRPLGLVTPYVPSLNEAIEANFSKEGITAVSGYRFLSLTSNHDIAEVDYQELTEMINQVLVKEDVSIITTFCTNLTAAPYASYWEAAHADRNLLILDSVSATVWGMLKHVGINQSQPALVRKWRKIFDISKL